MCQRQILANREFGLASARWRIGQFAHLDFVMVTSS
jgi:hypothetical protein